jgi:BolA family transcriptional regulator, general stress-responsive regulator
VTTARPEPVRAAEAEAVLRQALAPVALTVRDDSAAHAGHAGAREGSHLHVSIVSPRFTGLGRLARHRLVYDALRELIPRGIHALAIDARTPAEAAPGPL